MLETRLLLAADATVWMPDVSSLASSQQAPNFEDSNSDGQQASELRQSHAPYGDAPLDEHEPLQAAGGDLLKWNCCCPDCQSGRSEGAHSPQVTEHSGHDDHGHHWVDGFEVHPLTLLPNPEADPADPVDPEKTLDSRTPVDLADTFLLESKPGADHTIYLDFDGHTTSDTIWNGAYNDGQDIVTPAYDFDGNTDSFSNAELERIQWIWERVAEDFIPFDVNVTTKDPGVDALRNSGPGDQTWGTRVVIGGSSNQWWGSGAGGVAFVGSFNWNNDTPVFVFEAQLGNGNEKYTAEATSHEVGHALGLSHDGRSNPSEGYFQGHGSGQSGWAPIMGASYYKNVTQWSRGEYQYANQSQDDLAIITGNNGFGYRADDHGDADASASQLNVTNLSARDWGIIETSDDVDVFEFVAGVGTLEIDVSPLDRGPNLDVFLELYDSVGTLVDSASPSGLLSASLNVAVTAAQTFFLHVSGTGNGDPLTNGYSDYASLGQYFITGTLPGTVQSSVSISASDARLSEGNSGSTAFAFTVERSGNTSGTLSVDYSVIGSSSNAATAADFVGGTLPSGTVQFAAGEASQTLTIEVAGDVEFEPDEGFTVTLSNPVGGAALETASATGLILNDDTNSPSDVLNFNDYVIGSFDPAQDVSGTATIEDGGATLHLVGNTWKQIALPYQVTADTVLEFEFQSSVEGEIHGLGFEKDLVLSPDRVFNLYGRQSFSIKDYRDYAEDAPNTKRYVIPVGQFYTGDFNYLFFANDHDVANPTGESRFSNIRIYEAGGSSIVSISASDARLSEGNSGSTAFAFTVERSGNTSGTLSVDYSVIGSSSNAATAADFVGGTLPSGTVQFAAGEASQTLTIEVAGDVEFEPDEGFTVTLSNPVGGAALETASATGLILNDDTNSPSDVLNFNDYVIGSFDPAQDVSGTATIEDGGATLHLVGNTWKQIALPYQVTADTVLEFEFQSSVEGEIHGLGFEKDLVLSPDRVFNLYGRQSFSIKDYRDYAEDAPNTKRYVIPVGQFYTGDFNYLVFANDHDVANPTGEGRFSNIRIYEAGGTAGGKKMGAFVSQGSVAKAENTASGAEPGPDLQFPAFETAGHVAQRLGQSRLATIHESPRHEQRGPLNDTEAGQEAWPASQRPATSRSADEWLDSLPHSQLDGEEFAVEVDAVFRQLGEESNELD